MMDHARNVTTNARVVQEQLINALLALMASSCLILHAPNAMILAQLVLCLVRIASLVTRACFSMKASALKIAIQSEKAMEHLTEKCVKNAI